MSKDVVIGIVTVEAVPTAVRTATTTLDELPMAIGRLLDDVWAFIREAGDLEPHHNVVLYRGDVAAGPAEVEVGVQVGRRFDEVSAAGVRSSELPAGRAVRAVHVGPYNRMRETYDVIRTWGEAAGHTLRSPSWEVYGDWDDDPAKLETEIYFLLGDD